MLGFLSRKEFKNKRIKLRFKENIEPEEIFLDKLAKEREKEMGISEKKLEVLLSDKIIRGLFVFFILVIAGFFFRTFQFQVLEHDKFLSKANANKFVVHSVQAARGVIYDSKGKQLVFNKESFSLLLNKKEFREEDLREVAGIIKKDFKELKALINKEKDEEVLIAEDIDLQTLVLLESRIENLPGFRIKRDNLRNYIDGPIFSHVLGYMGRITSQELKKNPDVYSPFDYVGRDGLERSYEAILRKNPGKVKIKKDVFGNIVSKEVVSLPKPGKSLVLWLDADLQKKVKQSLENALKRVGAKKAVGIALDPKTGGVLALVSLPSFDNNLFGQKSSYSEFEKILNDPTKPLFNRVIGGRYPTGSTIKPLVALAALQEKIVSPNKNFNCQGKIVIPHPYDPESYTEKNDWRSHGLTDMRKAIAESCNVYFYTIGGGYKKQEGLGPSRIKKYLELFGWSEKTGIDLPGEIKGFIPSPDWKKETKREDWWDGDTYNLSIGQGDIMITPLEVVTAFAAIANGGILFSPRIVKEIVDENKNVLEKISPRILRKDFIDPEYIKIVKEGMRMAVTGENAPYASAKILNSLPVKAAAKTGTAETGRKNRYHNWITVFAPYENPEIVLTLMVEDVKTLQAAVLPSAKEILEWYFNNEKRKTD